MMNDIWVSIIVPAYNAEKYIGRCVDSLVRQECFEKLEILLINDGSTDHTGILMDNYSKNYGNIKTFHLNNSGVSNARNYGIEKAQGEYIAFVDADDWVERTCYKSMYQAAWKENADIAAAGISIDDDTGIIALRVLTNKNKTINKREGIKKFLYGDIDVHVCNKIFKTQVFRKYRFDSDIKIAEDRLFLFECLLIADRIVLLNQSYYHYYQNETSVMNQKISEKNLDDIKVAKKILDLTDEFCFEFLPYAEAMYIGVECRLYGDIIKYNKKSNFKTTFYQLKNDIRIYKVLKNLKYISKKHAVAIVLLKINPYLYNILRNNIKIKYSK